MSLWKWNDVELEVDMDDVDFQEKYENAFKSVGEKEKELQKIGNLSAISRQYCQMFYQLFDDIFGPGTGEKLFNGKYNVRIVEEAYDSFLQHCKTEVAEINKRRANTVKKYRVVGK